MPAVAGIFMTAKCSSILEYFLSSLFSFNTQGEFNSHVQT